MAIAKTLEDIITERAPLVCEQIERVVEFAAAGKALAPPPEETTLASSIDRQTTETGSQSSGIRWIVLLIILAATFVLYWVLNR